MLSLSRNELREHSIVNKWCREMVYDHYLGGDKMDIEQAFDSFMDSVEFQKKGKRERIDYFLDLIEKRPNYKKEFGSYFQNNLQEETCLKFVRNFVKEYDNCFPNKEESKVGLKLSWKNEFGCEKIITSFIKPFLFEKDDNFSDYASTTRFISDYYTFETLQNNSIFFRSGEEVKTITAIKRDSIIRIEPNEKSHVILSPSTSIFMQKGDSLDFSIVLASYLIGLGYNAFVCVGKAKKIICEKQTHKLRFDFEKEYKRIIQNEEAKNLKIFDDKISKNNLKNEKKKERKYKIKKRPEKIHEESLENENKIKQTAKPEKEAKQTTKTSGIEKDDEEDLGDHCWVVILPNRNDKIQNRAIFCDSSNGKSHFYIFNTENGQEKTEKQSEKSPKNGESDSHDKKPQQTLPEETNSENSNSSVQEKENDYLNSSYKGIFLMFNNFNVFIRKPNKQKPLSPSENFDYLSSFIEKNEKSEFFCLFDTNFDSKTDSLNKNIYLDNLEAPGSFSNELRITREKYLMKYPLGLKIEHFKNCVVAKIAPNAHYDHRILQYVVFENIPQETNQMSSTDKEIIQECEAEGSILELKGTEGTKNVRVKEYHTVYECRLDKIIRNSFFFNFPKYQKDINTSSSPTDQAQEKRSLFCVEKDGLFLVPKNIINFKSLLMVQKFERKNNFLNNFKNVFEKNEKNINFINENEKNMDSIKIINQNNQKIYKFFSRNRNDCLKKIILTYESLEFEAQTNFDSKFELLNNKNEILEKEKLDDDIFDEKIDKIDKNFKKSFFLDENLDFLGENFLQKIEIFFENEKKNENLIFLSAKINHFLNSKTNSKINPKKKEKKDENLLKKIEKKKLKFEKKNNLFLNKKKNYFLNRKKNLKKDTQKDTKNEKKEKNSEKNENNELEKDENVEERIKEEEEEELDEEIEEHGESDKNDLENEENEDNFEDLRSKIKKLIIMSNKKYKVELFSEENEKLTEIQQEFDLKTNEFKSDFDFELDVNQSELKIDYEDKKTLKKDENDDSNENVSNNNENEENDKNNSDSELKSKKDGKIDFNSNIEKEKLRKKEKIKRFVENLNFLNKKSDEEINRVLVELKKQILILKNDMAEINQNKTQIMNNSQSNSGNNSGSSNTDGSGSGGGGGNNLNDFFNDEKNKMFYSFLSDKEIINNAIADEKRAAEIYGKILEKQKQKIIQKTKILNNRLKDEKSALNRKRMLFNQKSNVLNNNQPQGNINSPSGQNSNNPQSGQIINSTSSGNNNNNNNQNNQMNLKDEEFLSYYDKMMFRMKVLNDLLKQHSIDSKNDFIALKNALLNHPLLINYKSFLLSQKI